MANIDLNIDQARMIRHVHTPYIPHPFITRTWQTVWQDVPRLQYRSVGPGLMAGCLCAKTHQPANHWAMPRCYTPQASFIHDCSRPLTTQPLCVVIVHTQFIGVFSIAGNFAPGSDNGTIMKKSDENEWNALKALMDDVLRPFVPEFKRVLQKDGHSILSQSLC